MEDYEKAKKSSWLLPIVIGMAIGIILVLFAMNSFPEKQTGNAAPPEVSLTAHADDDNRETEVTAAVEKAKDAVVSVTNYKGGNAWNGTGASPAGSGSGVIYKKEGSEAFVVTNHHVIDGASQIEITLSSGRKIPAKLLGSDALTDLAVLSIDGKGIKDVIEIGESKKLKQGASAIAIGNPLGFLEGTVTKGVISASNRVMPVDVDQNGAVDWQTEVIQTDASINPGNSGGALIDINGQLIGINSAKIAQDSVEGIGFAIPVHAAKPVIKDLEKHGEVRRPYIGIGPLSLHDLPTQYWQAELKLPKGVNSGVVVMEVSPGSPAAQAGLKQFDVITEIDGKNMKTAIDLRNYLYKDAKIGDSVNVTFYRAGTKETAVVKLGKSE